MLCDRGRFLVRCVRLSFPAGWWAGGILGWQPRACGDHEHTCVFVFLFCVHFHLCLFTEWVCAGWCLQRRLCFSCLGMEVAVRVCTCVCTHVLWMRVCRCALRFPGTRARQGHSSPTLRVPAGVRVHTPSLAGAVCRCAAVQGVDVAVLQVRFSPAARLLVFEQIRCLYASPRFRHLLPHHREPI